MTSNRIHEGVEFVKSNLSSHALWDAMWDSRSTQDQRFGKTRITKPVMWLYTIMIPTCFGELANFSQDECRQIADVLDKEGYFVYLSEKTGTFDIKIDLVPHLWGKDMVIG